MGMFDTVVVENLKLKLPKEVDAFLKKNNASLPKEFQTKDLDSTLCLYTIDSNNQIWSTQHVPTGKKIKYQDPFASWKDNRSFLERLYFKFKFRKLDKPSRFTLETKEVKKKEKINGQFNIYSLDEINERYLELDLNVTAVNGKATKIDLVKSSIESESKSRERHKNDQEFQLKMQKNFEARRKFTSKWYYPILKEVYNPVVFFTRESLNFLIGKLNIVLIRWRGI